MERCSLFRVSEHPGSPGAADHAQGIVLGQNEEQDGHSLESLRTLKFTKIVSLSEMTFVAAILVPNFCLFNISGKSRFSSPLKYSTLIPRKTQLNLSVCR